ncbi:hypothetical protein [Janthinobacterium fluminis]|uniref:Tetratricopeptide repeat protein n=1 Tax=Janthinobacterium fluminis TaxID=2987524 RepID=A0ABT5JUK8_9BURK|nr:hypothetical protein [Janthinobacterium fluminis]MDC8756410.1 hypothetical protein [Janthinobacterium fluminis]
MSIIKFLFAALVLLPFKAFAGVDCDKLDKAGDNIANVIPDYGSGRDIIGDGRLQFYSAPDVSCKMAGRFVLPGDTLFAKFDYKGFTKVSFIAMKKSDREITAWVVSSRLRENSEGIVPGHAPDVEEVSRQLQDGESAISQRKYESAIEICQGGLDAIGDAYWSKNIEDDTDLKLMAARLLRKDGKLENAASMYCGILVARLRLYNKR